MNRNRIWIFDLHIDREHSSLKRTLFRRKNDCLFLVRATRFRYTTEYYYSPMFVREIKYISNNNIIMMMVARRTGIFTILYNIYLYVDRLRGRLDQSVFTIGVVDVKNGHRESARNHHNKTCITIGMFVDVLHALVRDRLSTRKHIIHVGLHCFSNAFFEFLVFCSQRSK